MNIKMNLKIRINMKMNIKMNIKMRIKMKMNMKIRRGEIYQEASGEGRFMETLKRGERENKILLS